MEERKVPGFVHDFPFPVFGLKKPEGANDSLMVDEVESSEVAVISKKTSKNRLLGPLFLKPTIQRSRLHLTTPRP